MREDEHIPYIDLTRSSSFYDHIRTDMLLHRHSWITAVPRDLESVIATVDARPSAVG